MSNNFDKQYLDLLKDILENGQKKSDRTGTGTLSVFGRQIRHKMSDGFPAVTTKKLHFKGVVSELLWFLNGRTDLRYLLEHNNFIWVGDAHKKYMTTINEIIEGYKSGDMLGSQPHIENMFSDADNLIPLSEKEFIEKIKSDDEFDKRWGELGPIYGKQWRSWETDEEYFEIEGDDIPENIREKYNKVKYTSPKQIDQIANLINDLKTNPDSRRLMVSAWNVGELDQMTLPPCHYGFQVYTRELSLEERNKWAWDKWGITCEMESVLDEQEVPKRAISLMFNLRSNDLPLGFCYNASSYSLLLEIIAKTVNMIPDELIINIGDAHIYLNQIDGVNEQLGRELSLEERKQIFEDKGYVCDVWPFNGDWHGEYDLFGIPKRTREPYSLPTLKHMKTDEFYKSLGEDLSLLSHLTVDDFVLENYKSHPKIYFPLSN